VDLFPTICGLADIPIPEGLDGRSLLPLMEGREVEGPDVVYSELWKAHNGPSVMVKEGPLKYFRFDNGEGWPDQLFDLVRDPEERRNLASDPAYTEPLARLRARCDALPPPRRKDRENRLVDPYRPVPH
jgi:choline-sulfatase